MASLPPLAGGTSSWWAVWTTPLDPKVGQQQFHIISAASPPAAGVTEYGGIVVRTQGPFSSKAAAESAVGSSTGTSGEGPGIANPNSQANQPPSLTGLAAIGDFFSRLTEASTWERIGEVLLGLVLIAVGVAHITHAVPIATKVAKTAGAAAVL